MPGAGNNAIICPLTSRQSVKGTVVTASGIKLHPEHPFDRDYPPIT
jgi:hypothetical protein